MLYEGILFLGIEDTSIIYSIIDAQEDGILFREELLIKKKQKEEQDNLFKVPLGLTKKEYTLLLKDTQQKIDELKDILRKNPDNIFRKIDFEDFIAKKEKIKKALTLHSKNNNFTGDIQTAKSYPIQNLIEFNYSGFTKCLWHEQKEHESLHLDKRRNKVHCFSCGADKDSIDVYQKLTGASLQESIKFLSNNHGI